MSTSTPALIMAKTSTVWLSFSALRNSCLRVRPIAVSTEVETPTAAFAAESMVREVVELVVARVVIF
jgi:hypothetical protein